MATETPTKPPLNNLANQLTMSRLVLGVVLFVLIAFELWLWCLIVFVVAAITDWLDGYYARKYDLVSALGRMLDPLVDKIVVSGAFILLLTKPPSELPGGLGTGLAGWMVVVIVGREFLITGIRSFMEHEGIPFGADLGGKIKMILQCVVLIALFLFFALEQGLAHETFWADSGVAAWLAAIRDVLIWAMVIVTAVSGLNYCWKAMRGLKSLGG
jgi:CDP-diacylglycerol--glycerol-3-phosphate 3-phosphatidyltransferase